jgi:hypothetical protein
MRAHEERKTTEGAARRGAPARSLPTALPPLTRNPSAADVVALQRLAGNAAVSRMVEESRHQHAAECGHAQPVQRSAVDQVLSANGRQLSEPTIREMEGRTGISRLRDVRFHTGPVAQRAVAEVGAHAFTSGLNVVMPSGEGDKATLAHELKHVEQQLAGPVLGTDNGRGQNVSSPDDRFEKEAEASAREAMTREEPAGGW